MAGARLEHNDLDHSDLAAAIEAEKKKANEKKPPPAGIPDLDAIGLDVARVQGLQGSIAARSKAADDQVSRLDPRLKDSILSEMSGGIRRAAADASDADLKAAYTKLESIREAIATHFDPNTLRRRAVQPDDMRTWLPRLTSSSDRALEGFAADAFASSNLALGQLVLEVIDGRANVDSEIRAAVKRHVLAIPVPGAEAARAKLHEAEDAFADAQERVRILRGGRPSGLRSIRRGLEKLQRERSA